MNRLERYLGSQGEGYVVIQFLLLAFIAAGPWIASDRFVPEGLRTIAVPVGWLLMLAGLVMGLSGVRSLGSNITAVPRPKEHAELVRHGAYRIVRHPIYSGILLGCFGWSFFTGRSLVLGFTVALLLLFDIKSRREERWLSEKYEGYDAYQSRVRKLIPFVY